jgi:ATP-dependent DNA ligase
MWTNKQKNGYTIYTNEATETNRIPSDVSVETPKIKIRPMLAQKYQPEKNKTEFPFGASPKIDGVRAMAYKENGEVVLLSRLGTRITFLNNIKKQLDEVFKNLSHGIVLDGEIYNQDMMFEDISGAVRCKKNKHSKDGELAYWIFDCVFLDRRSEMPYAQRIEYLEENITLTKETNAIKIVKYAVCNNHDEFISCHQKNISDGWEGTIIRVLDAEYQLGYRSKYLLKYKEFEDDEFIIVGIKEGRGSEAGAIIFTCSIGGEGVGVGVTGEEQSDASGTFEVRPRGTIQKRREMYTIGDTYVGKYLTVRFQELSKNGIPRFPVGINVRDYE